MRTFKLLLAATVTGFTLLASCQKAENEPELNPCDLSKSYLATGPRTTYQTEDNKITKLIIEEPDMPGDENYEGREDQIELEYDNNSRIIKRTFYVIDGDERYEQGYQTITYTAGNQIQDIKQFQITPGTLTDRQTDLMQFEYEASNARLKSITLKRYNPTNNQFETQYKTDYTYTGNNITAIVRNHNPLNLPNIEKYTNTINIQYDTNNNYLFKLNPQAYFVCYGVESDFSISLYNLDSTLPRLLSANNWTAVSGERFGTTTSSNAGVHSYQFDEKNNLLALLDKNNRPTTTYEYQCK